MLDPFMAALVGFTFFLHYPGKILEAFVEEQENIIHRDL
jgi:hypothetical protein